MKTRFLFLSLVLCFFASNCSSYVPLSNEVGADASERELPSETACGSPCVVTVAGQPRQMGYQDGKGGMARLGNVRGLAVDKNGNVYLADSTFYRLRKVSSEGEVTTLAGTGREGSLDGPALQAEFSIFESLAFHSDGSLFLSAGDAKIRMLDARQNVSTFAGTGRVGGKNGTSLEAELESRAALYWDSLETLWIAGHDYCSLRRWKEGQIGTLIEGGCSYQDGDLSSAKFTAVRSMIEKDGVLFLADSLNHRIRAITAGGNVSTWAGSGRTQFNEPEAGNVDGFRLQAKFALPLGLAADKEGNLYVSQRGWIEWKHGEKQHFPSALRRINAKGNVETILSSDSSSLPRDGILSMATVQELGEIAFSSQGDLFFIDGFSLRKIKFKSCSCP